MQCADKLTHPLVRTVTRKDEWDTLQEHHDHVVLGVGVSREHLERHAREHPNKVFAHNPVGPKHVLYKRPHAEEPIKFEHPHHLHHHLDRHAFESVKDCDHAHINAVLEHGRHKAVLMLWNFDNAHEVAEIESGDVVTCVLQANSPLLEHYGVKGLKRAYLATKGHTYQQGMTVCTSLWMSGAVAISSHTTRVVRRPLQRRVSRDCKRTRTMMW